MAAGRRPLLYAVRGLKDATNGMRYSGLDKERGLVMWYPCLVL